MAKYKDGPSDMKQRVNFNPGSAKSPISRNGDINPRNKLMEKGEHIKSGKGMAKAEKNWKY
jgi:hypothetical protein